MTISIWRYSHLLLAVSSAIFICLASLTGIILAFEPISNQMQAHAVDGAKTLSLAEVLPVLQHQYDEVLTLNIDDNNFVEASVITKKGSSETFYINPFTAKKLGEPIKKKPIFEFATTLHRSLFLKSTGRFLVGFFSLCLCLIAITGLQLVAKRQGGFRRFFSKVIKDNSKTYFHVVLGRWTFIPILIITLTGVFLSLEKFDALPSHNLVFVDSESDIETQKRPVQTFEIFQTTTLDQFKTLEFPFSEDEDDYFILERNDKVCHVNQYTGQIISEAKTPMLSVWSQASLVLHTGQGHWVWALILLLSCVAILYFIYSGFAIAIQRKKQTTSVVNITTKDDAEYIVLIGSETGHTKRFARQFVKALEAENYKVYADHLNNYTTYKNAKHLVVFTATYGDGDAPKDAKNFERLLDTIKQEQTIKFTVLGFGSLLYPKYCQYAVAVNQWLQKHPGFIQHLPLFKINNQSLQAFKTWVFQWNNATAHHLKITLTKPSIPKKQLKEFKVIHNSGCNGDDTFLIELEPQKKLKFQSGDLIAFYPEADHIERQYSIGKIENNILLSIKKHDLGVCSKYLSTLAPHDMTKGKLKRNLDFHMPKYAKAVVMIANGTGIAPFLGMINETSNGTKTHLFWGGRTQASIQLYSEFIDKAFKENRLTSFHMAYSQEQADKVYVQDIIKEKEAIICNTLKDGGIIMICGSVAMQNGVLDVLNNITSTNLQQPLQVFENNEQLLMDCY